LKWIADFLVIHIFVLSKCLVWCTTGILKFHSFFLVQEDELVSPVDIIDDLVIEEDDISDDDDEDDRDDVCFWSSYFFCCLFNFSSLMPYSWALFYIFVNLNVYI